MAFCVENNGGIIMETNGNTAWWSESRFGMFIHFGIYSLKAKGEWVMYAERIPVKEYEKLADEFNPVLFDAEEYVKMAKETGMRYIVVTAKHHDGFSMFKTDVSPFNIVDSTPFQRDIMTELAQACKNHGIQLCFYYSHVREWHHPHAQSLEMHSPNRYGNYGNFWDYPNECQKNLQVYIDEFVKPQLVELLTKYGPIGIIWFDTPSLIRPDQAQELINLIKELQPNCLVNSRVGDDIEADYYSLGDCEVPDFNTGIDFETPMTICNGWGYNNMPNNQYRNVKELIHHLIDIVSLGGNYLLNVGPDSRGVIPEEAQDKLKGIGEWMKVNGESIYGTKASPFPAKPSWGKITAKGDTLYLHVYKWDEDITLTGIKNNVKAITLLADPGREITWNQKPCDLLGYDKLAILLTGTAPDSNASVLKVQFENNMRVETRIIEDDSCCIELPACLADIHSFDGKPQAAVNITGVVRNWFYEEDWFSWEFLCEHPGEYDVTATIGTGFHGIWDFGHEAVLQYNNRENIFRIEDTGIPTTGYQKRTFEAGRIQIDSAGLQSISIKGLHISRTNGQGLQMTSVNLRPVR